MDFLTSLGLEDLPEQQTRIPKSFSGDADFDLKLGFDACCSSGKVLTEKFCDLPTLFLYLVIFSNF